MKILIIHCHTSNRGDEAAIHAMVDELNRIYYDCKITICLRGKDHYPNFPPNVLMMDQYIPDGKKNYLEYLLIKVTRGRMAFSKSGKKFVKELKSSDIVLHAPGGPSIGDIYFDTEPQYLRIYDIVRIFKKKYMFYAPSMGPFNKSIRNKWRIKTLVNADSIALRDPISAGYVQKLLPHIKIYQTLDSAFQHEIDVAINEEKLKNYQELSKFLDSYNKCIGVTITDLLWHPVYGKKIEIQEVIKNSFHSFFTFLEAKGYGIVFIPQLYGRLNDQLYMEGFAGNKKGCFIIKSNDERYDSYFQQYVISRLYVVIGMRYHSNIFAAKMNTPFISISYEQKMNGFMKKMGLDDYCIQIKELSLDLLIDKFKLLIKNYDLYKRTLEEKHESMRKEAFQTTLLVEKAITPLSEKCL